MKGWKLWVGLAAIAALLILVAWVIPASYRAQAQAERESLEKAISGESAVALAEEYMQRSDDRLRGRARVHPDLVPRVKKDLEAAVSYEKDPGMRAVAAEHLRRLGGPLIRTSP
jgi:hypothetical protein